MGAKESRIGFLSYDEAAKRVTDVELKRLKDAFKRTSGLSCYMNQQGFIREVLGDVVPPKVAEVIYNSFGGTSKGLHFNNLIVGLVLLTRGRDEEKAKYIFSLFASESGSYVVREEMESRLQAVDGEVPPSLRRCFTEGEKVNYEKFKSWLLQNKDAFTFSRWLLSGGVCVTLTDDSDTPTFYQTLAGVTHLEESDIIDLEKRYWLLKAQSRTGRFDLETFVPLVSPPIHASLSEGLFNAFDENRDNHIDFKEISCGLSASCRGPLAERQKFCFKVFDIDRDGTLSPSELEEMVAALLEVWKDNRTDTISELHTDVSEIVEDILKLHDTTKDNKPIVVEQPCIHGGGKSPLTATAVEQGEDKAGIIHSYSSSEEKFSDNISTASEASETTGSIPTEKGATGLSNLGNTCFMNSSIQCVSNTQPLTQYFISGRHLYELNRTNPIGMRGHMAKCYGDLVQELWSGTQKNVAPLKLRWTIAKYAPRFNGFQQQDSQELLAFLLDGLHEDLNRVHDKPYAELKDSDGRPDWEVAAEAWENHLRRNRSIVVDLFHGQLKSQVKCKTCGHISARFDPFNFLSLPLPMDSYMHLEITVIKLDGSTPIRYGLRLNMDEKYTGLKKQLSELCSLKPEQILLAEVYGSNIKNFPQDNQKVRLSVSGFLCAFEIPVPGSPTSVSSPVQTELPSLANGIPTINSNGIHSQPKLIPNGMPSTVVPCGTERITSNGHVTALPESPFIGYIIAIHRKMMRTELYFLSSQKNRPSLFGMPLIVPCTVHTRKRDLYDAVWIQVSRLASPLPPQEASNHAQDCDDSMGYQYPFTLRVVQKDGNSCAWCPWYRFCRGCKVDCSEDRAFVGNAYIAIDWDPTALHLRYQTSQERIVEEHESVELSRRAQAEPISLDNCLRAFTSEEELGEDEMYYCSKCQTHRLATKKLDLWRLPPILIIHLKRFQFVNGRWIKSQKIVKFPCEQFDPGAFLVPRDPGPCQHREVTSQGDDQSETKGCEITTVHTTGTGDGLAAGPQALNAGFVNNIKASQPSGKKCNIPSSRSSPCNSPKNQGRGKGRLRLPQLGGKTKLSSSKESLDMRMESGSELEQTASSDLEGSLSEGNAEELLHEEGAGRVLLNGLGHEKQHNDCSDHHPHSTDHQRDQVALKPLYNLYAISCHSGILGGGHYVTYAKNPNDKWYCFNDSSCKWTIAKYAPRFNGFQQQDSQELLAFLLDGLHEDLNRVHDKPYAELKDSDGRPDWEVAAEAWENHLRRNRSIVVDLFHGQLKSQVKCKTCGHISARFDPFNFLSLPLPMDSYMHLEITGE
ncbi:Ubiquitin carboxyl-terminal hydrolase 32 [Acipenser ruthenus]|uniref:Ubiquitin carboxyl-terminal hydrolase 32 n=1 Tax=Acipenser ruthenus TaxID=7906 RepID=A0A444V7A2_ACIRT|nr:Ubiquitin carboxyl-terminal hydrolase 32 [Acipenser ruthenus]